jgi:hypothetical protein
MIGHLLKSTLHIRFVSIRARHARFEIVRNYDRWRATKMLKSTNVRCDLVVQILGPGRFRVGVAADAKHTHENRSLAKFARTAVVQ